MTRLQRIVLRIKNFNYIEREDLDFVRDKLIELDGMKDTCPHCGTTEMLCGYNGRGCEKEASESPCDTCPRVGTCDESCDEYIEWSNK